LSEQYSPEEPTSFDAIVERQPYEPPKESADPFPSGRDGIQEAADELSLRRETKEVTLRRVHDPDDLSQVAPKDVTWSKETAADALSATRAYEAELKQAQLEQDMAAAVDDFRGAPSQPEAQTAEPQPQPETPPAEPTELDRLRGTAH
jgi:hypothetical protein